MTTGWFLGGIPATEILVMAAWMLVLVPVSVKLFTWS
jgi:hypothetical protein